MDGVFVSLLELPPEGLEVLDEPLLDGLDVLDELDDELDVFFVRCTGCFFTGGKCNYNCIAFRYLST